VAEQIFEVCAKEITVWVFSAVGDEVGVVRLRDGQCGRIGCMGEINTGHIV
jgi:hypothetical protein